MSSNTTNTYLLLQTIANSSFYDNNLNLLILSASLTLLASVWTVRVCLPSISMALQVQRPLHFPGG